MNAPIHLPPITLASSDYNRLMLTVMIRQTQEDGLATFLLDELRRAEICHPARLPDDVVSLNSRVIYRVDNESKTRAHLLVHPDDLIWPGAEISVATPLGTALLGLSVGDCVGYRDVDGTEHEVQVEGIGLRFLDDGLILTRASADTTHRQIVSARTTSSATADETRP
jgi:regulator of nucleoside diphosphate kinase